MYLIEKQNQLNSITTRYNKKSNSVDLLKKPFKPKELNNNLLRNHLHKPVS